MWEYVLGGAAVFGLIVTVGAWINGRITRKEISELIKEEHEATRKLIAKMDERFVRMDERFRDLLGSLAEHSKASSESHQAILKSIKELTKAVSRKSRRS